MNIATQIHLKTREAKDMMQHIGNLQKLSVKRWN